MPTSCLPVRVLFRPASSRRASPHKAHTLPSGGLWLHEIKHDGFRIIARKDGERVRLYSRPGNDFTRRFPLIVETLARLRSRSCIIDGRRLPVMTTASLRSIAFATATMTKASFYTPST